MSDCEVLFNISLIQSRFVDALRIDKEILRAIEAKYHVVVVSSGLGHQQP